MQTERSEARPIAQQVCRRKWMEVAYSLYSDLKLCRYVRLVVSGR